MGEVEETLKRDSNKDLVGDVSTDRLFACWFDQFLASLCSVLMLELVAQLNPGLELSGTLFISLLAVPFFLYFFLSEAVFSCTVGKVLNGLTVRTLDGSRCSAGAAFIRSAFGVPECIFQPLTVLVVYITPRHQRIGDLLAGTVVVRSSGKSAFKEILEQDRQPGSNVS